MPIHVIQIFDKIYAWKHQADFLRFDNETSYFLSNSNFDEQYIKFDYVLLEQRHVKRIRMEKAMVFGKCESKN